MFGSVWEEGGEGRISGLWGGGGGGGGARGHYFAAPVYIDHVPRF